MKIIIIIIIKLKIKWLHGILSDKNSIKNNIVNKNICKMQNNIGKLFI